MKKLMIMAIMLVASAAAFAGDSDGLKAIKKAKTYAEAEQLLKQNLDQLEGSWEKAEAYNHLTDLAYEAWNTEDNKRMLQQPYDENLLSSMAINALKSAMECDKYDQMPNKKGKVDPDFHKDNQKRMGNIRLAVINAGVDAANAGDNAKGHEAFVLYLNSAKNSLFADDETIKTDPNLGLASFYAGRCAILMDDYASAITDLDVALTDTAEQIRDGAFDFKLYAMRMNQKTAADSAQYLKDIQALAAQYPNNEKVFANLGDAYMQRGLDATLAQICNERIAADPQDALGHIYLGMIAMNAKNYEEAIDRFGRIPETNANFLPVTFNRGVCRLNLASDFLESHANKNTGVMKPDDDAKFKQTLSEAKVDLEKARELDPEQQNVRWAVLLRNIYYQLGEEAKYQELENM